MTSSAALSVIRHAATLAIGPVRSGSYMRPVRAENGEKFAVKLTQLHLGAVKRPERESDPGLLSLPAMSRLGLLSSSATC